jgi:hypothetical protein
MLSLFRALCRQESGCPIGQPIRVVTPEWTMFQVLPNCVLDGQVALLIPTPMTNKLAVHVIKGYLPGTVSVSRHDLLSCLSRDDPLVLIHA